MPRARALTLAALLAVACADDALFQVTDEEYYQMPALFALDEYEGCLATRGAYCLGSFELAAAPDHQLYRFMQRVSANWVDNFNHTLLHRGLCLSRSCASHEPLARPPPLDAWFSSCVNETTMSQYNLSARLQRLEYCSRGPAVDTTPLSTNERAFAGLLAALLALAAVSTVLDLTLPDHARKGARWALSWSVRGCWAALHAAPQAAKTPPSGTGTSTSGANGGPTSGPSGTDLRALDGLRVLCMMCVIIEHVCWLTTQHYVANTREYEQMRRALDVMLMINSTLVVQIFFLMSSFLLAHKLLQQRRRPPPALSTFCETLLNRIIRVSPSYFVVVWFAASWWARLGRGPLWAPLVEAEASVCRAKWWTHLLYLNNVLYADDKCLIQTWYLAADMQLYALALALTLVLRRWRRAALSVLVALLAGSIALLFALAYAWHLVPTYVMHRPELVRAIYSGESSFNVLYQSPLSNSPGALAGLLLAHTHHALLDAGVRLNDYKAFRWVSTVSPLVAVWWAAGAPRLLGEGAPARGPAAALAALERPVFSLFVALGLLGAMHNIKSPLRSVLSWRGWATPARLSFGVLLLHMPIDKSLVAARPTTSQLNRHTAILEWFGVALASFLCALPLALLVELPTQRLYAAFRAALKERHSRDTQKNDPGKADM